MGPFLRAPGNYDADVVSDLTGLLCDPEEGLTQQQFKEDSDINVIVSRFGLTGELPDDFRPPVSGDFRGITNFHDALNAVRAAEESFMELPGELRKRFSHDPQLLIEFVEDGRNRDEAVRLGLIPAPVVVPVVDVK